jgi:thymidylate kinase
MDAHREKNRVNFVSFSGIDGAGKSTQIDNLCAHLRDKGLRVLLIRFWDDVARLTRLREETGQIIFKGDKGIGTPSAPVNRRDKNVQSWPMTWIRWFLYFLDVLSIRRTVKKALGSGADVVVFDRYIYDELANLRLSNRATRVYVRMIMKLVPKPDVSYLLDADPAQARARKPEYPLAFLRTNRQSYLDLSDFVGGITVIAAMPIQEVTRSVVTHALTALSLVAMPAEKNFETASRANNDEGEKLDGPRTLPASS